MTYEEMQQVQREVADALRAGGFGDVEALPFEPGALPDVMFRAETETEGSVALAVTVDLV